MSFRSYKDSGASTLASLTTCVIGVDKVMVGTVAVPATRTRFRNGSSVP